VVGRDLAAPHVVHFRTGTRLIQFPEKGKIDGSLYKYVKLTIIFAANMYAQRATDWIRK
jgi:hypothetical protein